MSDIIYTPKTCTDLNKLLNVAEYYDLLGEINKSNLSEDKKVFLRLAATRFIRFNYEKIADYYESASPEMRQWVEALKLVVVDYDNAIAKGYLKFQTDYKNLIEEIVNE